MKLKKKKTLPLSRGKILVKNYLKNIPRKYCFQESYFLKIDTKHGRLRLQTQDSEKIQNFSPNKRFLKGRGNFRSRKSVTSKKRVISFVLYFILSVDCREKLISVSIFPHIYIKKKRKLLV